MSNAINEIRDIQTEVRKIMSEYQGWGERYDSVKNSIEEQRTKLDEVIKSVDGMAKSQLRSAPVDDSGRDGVTPEMRGMIEHICKRGQAISNPVNGGYLTVPDFVAKVESALYDENPLAQYVETVKTSGDITEFPFEVSRGESHWVGENESRAFDDTVKFGLAKIPVNEVVSKVKITQRLMESSVIAIRDYMINRLTETMNYDIGKALIDGNGVNKPMGVWSAKSKVPTINAGSTTAISYDNILDMMATPSSMVEPRAKFYGNKWTYNALAKVKDQQGQYLLQPAVAEGLPMTLYGVPCIKLDSAPRIASGGVSLVYGDMFKAYKMPLGADMTYQDDPYTDADNGNVVVRFRRRVGGAVVMKDALVGLKMSA